MMPQDFKIYLAKPCRSWQGGLNENTNGLLRRPLPKAMKAGGLKRKRLKRLSFRLA